VSFVFVAVAVVSKANFLVHLVPKVGSRMPSLTEPSLGMMRGFMADISISLYRYTTWDVTDTGSLSWPR
jgi:hypothetical protein